MSAPRKAIIIGGGPAGLAAALRLHQRTNISCTVYELRPEPTTIGGAIGILPNGTRLLHRLGVLDKLLSRGSSHSNIVIHSMQGKILGEQDMTRVAKEQTGFGYMRIKRADLLDVLLEAIDQAKIPVHYNKRITSITTDEDGARATFSDGTTDSADLLLGCDGIHSSVRRLYVDPDREPEYSGMAGIGAIVPASLVTESAVSPILGMHATMTQQGLFMAMTCTASDEEIYWGFSHEASQPESGDARDGWEVRRKEEVEGFKSTLHGVLEGASGEWGGMMRRMVDHTSVVKFYPVYKLPLEGAWSKGRVILLGDAAHAMPPHAGQGVSMALEDVFLLSRLLEDPARSIGDVYKSFAEIRRPRVDEISARATSNADMRKKTGPWGLWLKEVGIRMYMHGSWAFGRVQWGSEQKHMVYDIDKEKI